MRARAMLLENRLLFPQSPTQTQETHTHTHAPRGPDLGLDVLNLLNDAHGGG